MSTKWRALISARGAAGAVLRRPPLDSCHQWLELHSNAKALAPGMLALHPFAPTDEPSDVRKDPAIAEAVETSALNGSPLKVGETAALSGTHVIVGATYNLNNGTLVDGYGKTDPNFTGTVRPIAYIPVDQYGNIIKGGNDVFVGEIVKTVNGQRPTTSEPREAPKSGVFIDLQTTGPGIPITTINQTVVVSQGKTGFKTGPNEITKDAAAGKITIKLGPTVRIKF